MQIRLVNVSLILILGIMLSPIAKPFNSFLSYANANEDGPPYLILDYEHIWGEPPDLIGFEMENFSIEISGSLESTDLLAYSAFGRSIWLDTSVLMEDHNYSFPNSDRLFQVERTELLIGDEEDHNNAIDCWHLKCVEQFPFTNGTTELIRYEFRDICYDLEFGILLAYTMMEREELVFTSEDHIILVYHNIDDFRQSVYLGTLDIVFLGVVGFEISLLIIFVILKRMGFWSPRSLNQGSSKESSLS